MALLRTLRGLFTLILVLPLTIIAFILIILLIRIYWGV